MNKYLLENFGITKLILIVVTLSSAVSIFVSVMILNQVIESHDEEMIQVIAGDIHDDINSEIAALVTISQTMASDSFLKQTLKNFSIPPQEMNTLVTEYLNSLKNNFGCSAAFLAVESSKHYFTLNGFQKTLNWRRDYHDIWYKNFLDSNVAYSLHVDTDEASDMTLTVFVNTRIEDDDKILGVCGVGQSMTRLQEVLRQHEKNYGVDIFLVDTTGLVEVDTDSENIERIYLEKLTYKKSEDFVLNKVPGKRAGYIITKYIPQFDWFMVIERDSDSRQSAFSNLVLYLSIAWVILLAFLLTFIQTSLAKGEKQIADSATRQGIASHSGVYASMHLLDLKNNTIQELSNNLEVKVLQIEDGNHAKEKLYSAVKKITAEKSLLAILEFIRPDNLLERIGDKQAIYQEFLSETFGWCKAYFMLMDSKKIVFAIEIIDDEKRREKHLKHLSETDLMTGLLNRGTGEKEITELMAKEVAGMFCLLDADKFKSINDNFGHEVGDKVIKAIATCLKNALKSSDVILRLGGDEFAFYAIGVTSEVQAKIIFGRLFDFLENVAIPELGERKISVSLGAAFFNPDSAENFTELYKRADSGAYISKKTSGNCATFAPAASEELRMENGE